jgi:hypothetical protein
MDGLLPNLDNPALALVQWNEAYGVVAGRLPPALAAELEQRAAGEGHGGRVLSRLQAVLGMLGTGGGSIACLCLEPTTCPSSWDRIRDWHEHRLLLSIGAPRSGLPPRRLCLRD